MLSARLIVPLDDLAIKEGLTQEHLNRIDHAYAGTPRDSAVTFFDLLREGKLEVFHELLHRQIEQSDQNWLQAAVLQSDLLVGMLFPCAYIRAVDVVGLIGPIGKDKVDVLGRLALELYSELREELVEEIFQHLKSKVSGKPTSLDMNRFHLN